MSGLARNTVITFVVTISMLLVGLPATAGTATAAVAASQALDDPSTASISGSITWQAIPDGGSETLNPIVELDTTGDTTDGGRDAFVSSQPSTDGTYDFEGLTAGSYVVKVTDYTNYNPTSYYPTTYYGGKYNYEDATTITLTAGQVSSGNNIDMLIGATVIGKITGEGGAALSTTGPTMESTTGAGASAQLLSSRNDGVQLGFTHLDEMKYGTSDSSGNVLIRGIAPDTYEFWYYGGYTFAPDGHEYASSYWTNTPFARDAKLLTVKLGTTYTVNQTMSELSYVGGSIKDLAGTPIQGGYAVLYNSEEATDDSAGIVNTTGLYNGSWGFDELGPGTYKVGFTQAANGVTPSGALAASYPFVSSWYGGTSYATATKIVVTAGHNIYDLPGVMPYDESFLDTWVSEQSGGKNASEPYCQCFSGDPINDATGEFFLNGLTDVNLPGVGPAVALQRNYSSTNAQTTGPFGYGWSTALSSRLDVVTPSSSGPPQVVQVTQENGATVRFTLDVNGNYEAPPRVLAALALNPDGSWTFTRRGTTLMNFSSTGQLTSIADLHGNAVSYVYNSSGQVSTISGSGGRQIDLTWDGAHITAATDSAGRIVGFGYDTAGDLTGVTGVDGNASRYSYDANHQMLTTVKPDGGVTTNVYDSSGRVTHQTDAAGHTAAWAYSGDTADETTTVTTADGAVHSEHYLNLTLASSTVAAGTSYAATTSYQYDEALDVVTKTDPLGKSTQYTWDTNGNKLTETTPLHQTTSWSYDALNDLTSTSDPDGNYSHNNYDSAGNLLAAYDANYEPTTYTYNPDGTVATRTTPKGGTYSYSYDPAGRPISVEDPYGATKSTTYDSAGFITSTTDALAHTTSQTVDPEGRVLTATDPLGNVTAYIYDSDGNRITATDPEGHVTTYVYDVADEKTSSTDPDRRKTSYAYGANGLLASTTVPDGGRTRYDYNAAEEKSEMVNPLGDKTAYHYDLDGRLRATIAPGGATTITGHNADGDATSVKDPNGHTTKYTFDAEDRQLTSTDPLGRVTTTAYTADGKVASITQPDTSTKSWVYDPNGNVTSFTNADGLTTTYAYDADDRQTSATQPGGLTTAYAYDAAGRVITTTKPDGSYITTAYDADGHLTSSHPNTTDAITTTFHYGADGERHSMRDASGTTSYSYDPAGQMRAVTNGAGQKVIYTNDLDGQIKTLTYPSGNTVNYTYDKADQMASAKDWNGNTTTFTWTAAGKLATQTGPDGVTETRNYDAADNTTEIRDTTTSSTLANYGYGYDAAEQLTSDSATDPDVTTLNHTYTYDSLGQMSSASDGTTSMPYSATPGGELTASAAQVSATYNSAQQVAASTAPGGTTATYSYDANGERNGVTTTTGSIPTYTSYGYDSYGNLASATVPTGAAVIYTSNADGLRQSVTTGTTTHQLLWDTQSQVALLLDDGTNSYIYGPSTTPLAQIADADGTTQYLHSDLIGSVRVITNTSGTAIGITEYDPYGNRTSHSGTADSNLGYTGALTDQITGLVYLRARDYDPITGGFLTVDPAISISTQPYAYVGNDPLQFSDALGLVNGWAIVGAVGLGIAIAGLALTGVGLAADAPLIAVESVVFTEATVDTVAVVAADGAAETAVGATIETTEVTTATVASDSATSGYTIAGRAVNSLGSGLDAANCAFTHDATACVAATLGFGGVGLDLAGGALITNGFVRYAAALAAGGIGAAGSYVDISSGVGALEEIAREGDDRVRC